MTTQPEFDPDDDDADDDGGAAFDEGATLEALLWQWLLLVNPGDEELALQQFSVVRDALAEGGEPEPLTLLRDVTDWRSGFHVQATDTRGFVECIDELVARWNLRLDWGVEDPTDDEFLDAADLPMLMATAYDRLREHGYTLWHCDAGDDAYAGWIALARDDEAMRAIAAELGVELRLGNDAS